VPPASHSPRCAENDESTVIDIRLQLIRERIFNRRDGSIQNTGGKRFWSDIIP
jgi:hypothetical protein